VAADFELAWSSLDASGGKCGHDGYELAWTAGQHDTGLSLGGGFSLQSGYWTGSPGQFCHAADLNCDGAIDGGDLAIVLGSWGQCAGCIADIDGDGVVGGADLAAVLGAWGLL